MESFLKKVFAFILTAIFSTSILSNAVFAEAYGIILSDEETIISDIDITENNAFDDISVVGESQNLNPNTATENVKNDIENIKNIDFFEITGLTEPDELEFWEDETDSEESDTEEFPEPDVDDEEFNLMSASTVKTYSKSAQGSTYLSKNFKVSEFACNDGSDTVLIDSELVTILQNIRDHFGTAVTINSAYRTASYNAKVGGASNSYHVKGMAADIKVSGVTPADVAKYAETIGVRGVGRYNTFVHVDSRPSKYYWRNSGSSNVSVSTHGGTFNAYPYGSSTPSSGKNPEGVIDSCSGGSGSVSVRGWAFDRDDTGTSIPIHVYIGGPAGSSNAEGYEITANVLREDVNNVYGVGNYHGYDAKINTNKTGNQDVYIYACNIGSGENALLGSRTVNITPRASELKYWLSASDMGSEITECEVGGTYYLCYKMYDTNSGDYFNSYSSESYKVKLTFYDINGAEIGSREFTNTDRASVQFMTTVAGTCSYKVSISGFTNAEATKTFIIKSTAPQTYKVTYNANGGQNAPASQTKTENVDLKLTTQKPTRTGYEFYGWGKTATTNTASYSSGGTYKDNASITLYAVWIPIQYIVKYNANGGSGEMNTQLFLYDTAKNLSANTFTRTNYTFKNWNTKADGSGVSYSDGASVKNLSSTKGATFNLYAIWNGISVTGVNLNKTSLSLKVGGTSTLTATVLPSNATNKTVSWKSSNTSVATVSNGVVTAKAVGTATITAVTSDGNKTATCSVTVTSSNVAVTSISLNKTSTTLDVGKTETLTATVLPSNATNKTVSWTSSNTSVATVSNGVVTAKSAGTATITAKTVDGSKTATCTVKVNSPVDENAPKVQVKNVIGKAGNTVDVVLKVENNPGIAVLGFKVGYDSSAMTLQSVTVNDVFSSSDITAGDISKNPYTISAMSAAANIKANGNLVTLTFKIKDNCNNGVYAITLTEPEAYNINEQTVTFTLVNGTVTVKDVEPGDITADGSVNRLDLLRLGKYLADWDVEISEAASDVTGDGNVNRLDLLRLGKFLADWDVVLGQ